MEKSHLWRHDLYLQIFDPTRLHFTYSSAYLPIDLKTFKSINMKCPTISAICVLALAVLALADDKKTREDLRSCVTQQLRDDNQVAIKDNKLSKSELSKLESLINHEVDQIPLRKYDDQKQQKSINNIKEAAVDSLPSVSTEKLHEVLFKLKATAGYCVTDLKINTK